MATNLDEAIEFLAIANKQGFLNDNTVNNLRTGCNKLFAILEPDQKTVEYVLENIDTIKVRFSNRNKEVRGNTVNEYARRALRVLNDFVAWKADRPAWESQISARQNNRPVDEEKKPRPLKADKSKSEASDETQTTSTDARTVTFAMRPDFEVSIKLPRAGISVNEWKKLVYFLWLHANDWEPTQSPRMAFPLIESNAA